MVKNYKLLIIGLCIYFLIGLAYAQTSFLELSSDKSVYSLGENILIYAQVENTQENPVLVNLESVLENEKGNYPLAIIPTSFELEPNETRKVLIYDILVDENMNPDLYTYTVSLLFDNERITKQSLSFSVINTLEDFSFDINVCKDSSCEEESKMFIKEDKIYLDYNSNLEPEITAILTYPDKTSETIGLPNTLEASQIGTYELEVTASKENYKTISLTEQFGVIEKAAEVQSISVCNGNGICDSGENSGNCPQDCSEEIRPSNSDSLNLDKLLIILGVGAGILIIALIYFILKKKRE